MTFAEFTARMRMMIQTMPHREQALRLLALGTLALVVTIMVTVGASLILWVALALVVISVLAAAVELVVMALDDNNFQITPPTTFSFDYEEEDR